MPLDMNM